MKIWLAAAWVHAIENGEDLSEYTMIAFGGAAPLHAARLCEKLGIARCLVPTGAGVGSAIGFLCAPFSFEANRSVFMPMRAFDAEQIKALFAEYGQKQPDLYALATDRLTLPSNIKSICVMLGRGGKSLSLSAQQMPASQRQAVFLPVLKKITNAWPHGSGMEAEITVWSVNAFTPTAKPERVQDVAAKNSC